MTRVPTNEHSPRIATWRQRTVAILMTALAACDGERPPGAMLDTSPASAAPAGTTKAAELPAPSATAAATGAADAGPDAAAPWHVLADGRRKPGALTRDGASLYWLDEDVGDGKLLRMPIGGGAPTVLASGLIQPDSLRVDGARAYWLAYGAQAGIHSVTIGGGAPTRLVEASTPMPLRQLALGEGHVYFTDGPGGAVRRVPKAGGAVETVATGLAGPAEIVVAGAEIYVLESGERGRIVRLDGSSRAPIATEQAAPVSLVVGATDLYWINTGVFDPGAQVFRGAGILRAPRAGGATSLVAAVEGASNLHVGSGGELLYVVGESLFRLPAGGTPAAYAASQATPRTPVSDGSYAYWANAGTSANQYGDGQILRHTLR